MNKLNIGLFVDTYYPMVDGVVMVVDNYAKRLSKWANVYVFAPTIPKKTNDDSKYNYKIIRCKSLDVPFLDYALPLPDIDKEFKKKVEECNLDIVHIHSPVTIGNVGLKYAKKHNIPVVATMHSQYKQDFMRATKSKIITKKLTNHIVKFFEKCDECWTLNKDVAKVLTEDYGYTKQPILINNATEMKPIENIDQSNDLLNKKYNIIDEKVLLFVGRINKLKNIDLIVKSLSHVKKIKYKMFIIGTGQDEEYLEKLIKKHKLENNVLMIGKITDREELARYYARADLFIFPSMYDTNSLVQIEAASQNTPTLFLKGAATASSITADVNGYIGEFDEVKFARKIEEILLDEEKLKQVSINAHKDIYKQWDEEVERIYNQYKDLINRKNKKDI